MLGMVILRDGFLICVPLFLMLSGYLIRNKEPVKAYYLKIVRILYVYFAASAVCAVYRMVFLRDGMTIVDAVLGVLSFETVPYSWYIEMYIGLFLLIPFLNTMYDGLKSRKNRQALILTLLFLSAAPSVMNIYRLDGWDWWLMPSKNSEYLQILPAWWTSLTPLLCFFLGRYFRDYPISLSCGKLAALYLAVMCCSGAFSFYRSYGSVYIWGDWQSACSFFHIVQTCLVFCFFLKLSYEKLPPFIAKVFAVISDLSLGAYLTSYVFDGSFYAKLNNYVSTMQGKMAWFPIMVLSVLAGSLACSFLIHLSYSVILKKWISRLEYRANAERS